MKLASLTIVLVFGLITVAEAAPIQPRGIGFPWNIINPLGPLFDIASLIYGLIHHPSSSSPTQTGGPYGPYYQYPNANFRGASFLPRPDNHTAQASAAVFVQNGGRWTNDGHTLPGTLSLENAPYSSNCYGLDPDTLVGWTRDFQSEYYRLTSKYPIIRTSLQFWSDCMSNDDSFGMTSLWIVQPGSVPTTVPPGWQNWTLYDDGSTVNSTSTLAIVVNGGLEELQAIASAALRSVRIPGLLGFVVLLVGSIIL